MQHVPSLEAADTLCDLSRPVTLMGFCSGCPSNIHMLGRVGKAWRCRSAWVAPCLIFWQYHSPVQYIQVSLGTVWGIHKNLPCNWFAGIGIVERVVLLGTPQNLDTARWESVRKVMPSHAQWHKRLLDCTEIRAASFTLCSVYFRWWQGGLSTASPRTIGSLGWFIEPSNCESLHQWCEREICL